MTDDQERVREHARTQTESSAAAAGHEVGLKTQARQVSERKNNPEFYEKFTRSSLADSKKWSHLFDEYETWLADDHVLANRRQVYRLQRELLNRVRAQQATIGKSPAALLREKPLVDAIWQDVHPRVSDPVPLTSAGQQSLNTAHWDGYDRPMTSDDRAAVDDLANVATARQSMGVESAGTEALTTATTESRTVREDQTEESGIMGSVSGVFD